jgi:hypothetical protein
MQKGEGSNHFSRFGDPSKESSKLFYEWAAPPGGLCVVSGSAYPPGRPGSPPSNTAPPGPRAAVAPATARRFSTAP